MWVSVFIAICSLVCVNCYVEDSSPIVNTNLGKIRGYTAKSRVGITYYGFHAIPFAQPPVGALRFKPTEPAAPWNGIHDGTQDGVVCPQLDMATRVYMGTEDCLHLNVYTPKLSSDKSQLLPVLFWIHGGGFVGGSGINNVYGPQNFMDEPVVLVSINYRLGVLGFLSTEDENAYGNFGMLDQVMALRWVQENIAHFGGDPNRVTLIGLSAGSAAVLYQVLSPLSQGLFHKAIAMSGAPTSFWAFNKNPLKVARSLAASLHCPDTINTQSIIQCLSEKSEKELATADYKLRAAYFYPNHLSPTVEPQGGPGFLTQEPLKLLQEGKIANKVPVVLGYVSHEGYSLYYDLAKIFKLKGREYFQKEFPKHLPLLTEVQPHMVSAIEAIAKEYYDDVEGLDNEEVFNKVGFSIVGHSFFDADISLTAELLSKANIPTYAYIWNHLTERCLAEVFNEKCGKYCGHADDLFLMFRFLNLTLDRPDDVLMSQKLNRLWTSFAYDREMFISPDETWPIYDTKNRQYVELDFTPQIKNGPLSDKMKFWTETIPELVKKDSVLKDEL